MRKIFTLLILLCVAGMARGQDETVTGYNCECLIDGVSVKQGTMPPDGGQMQWQIDASTLSLGLHHVQTRIVQHRSSGVAVTAVYDAFCYRISNSSHHEVTATCYVDDELKKTSTINADGEPISWLLDLSDLPEGVHQVRVDITDKNNEGVVTTSTYEGTFYREAPSEGHEVTAECYVDEQLVKTQTIQANGAVNVWTLDLATMKRGMHHVRVSVTDKDGYNIATSSMFDAMCYRGMGRVTSCEYWVNDDNSTYNHVQLSEPQAEYTFISLLPVPKQNIRTKKFHFEIQDGQPMLYARNDFRMRFNTEDGSFTDVNSDYVDYRTSQSVNAETLLSGEHKTINRPNDNDIKWFKLDATRGDSLRFNLDKACTLQLFAPNNQELLAVDGAEAVKWNGITVWSTGTYYLAIHDMTATTGNVINLDYELIDHYAILRQDVNIVGNGGASNIKFDGNGFDYLDSLCLVKGDKVIVDYNTNHISNSQIDVMFDFTDCELGKYDLIGYFDGETRTIPNAIEIVEADSIKLAFNVSYPSQFLRGTSTTYTFKITNKGNSTAYQVPLEIQIYTSSQDAITYAKFSDNVPTVTSGCIELFENLYDSENYSELDSIEFYKQKTLKLIMQKGDMLHFLTMFDSIDCKYIKDAYFMLNVPAKTTIVITLTMKSNESIDLLALLPSVWDYYNPNDDNEMLQNIHKRGFGEFMCCHREHIQCIGDVIVGALDLATIFNIPNILVADCVANIANDVVVKFAFNVLCGEKQGGKNIKEAIADISWRIAKSIFGCLMNKAPGGKISKGFATYWTINHIYNNISIPLGCIMSIARRPPNCPPDPPHGGKSSPVAPHEPNEMLGYTSPSGSHYIGKDITDVYYTICFENDSAATSPANVIILTDTIDGGVHDLNTFVPTRVKIGDVEAQLSGEPNFIQTVDMRPRINCIAQIECDYDNQKGTAVFTLTSLDPMTLEPVTDHNQGMLPPNGIGNYGQGEMSFNISLKEGLPDGTVIKNHADNIFDNEEPVFTPDWENIIDAVNPTSRALSCELVNDSTAAVTIESHDNLSGPWRYDVMVQYGEGSDWFAAARAVPADSVAHVRVYEGIDHNFCVVLTDSAGNVENKALEPEISFDYFDSSTNSELTLALAKNWNWMSHNLNAPLEVTVLQPNAYRIVGQDGETIKDPSYGYTGTISTLDPTKLYKVQMNKATNVPLQGKLYNVAFKSTDLSTGWNWLGYPLAGSLAPGVALANLEAQEGDCLIGQDGMAMFSNGQWSGTLSQLTPGKGYMLKLQDNATLHWNSPRVSTRQHAPGIKQNGKDAPYSVDAHLYPNVMGIVADLYDSGSPVDVDDYWLVAFCGDECRGVAHTVDGHMMMNVYGNSGETITFKVVDRTTQAIHEVAESRQFAQDVEGTLQQPMILTIGTSGINTVAVKGLRVYPTVTKGDVNVSTSYGDLDNVEVLNAKGQTVMSLQNMGGSAVIGLSDQPDGIYMIRVTTANGTSTTKVVKQK
jgi:hypothetical protein